MQTQYREEPCRSALNRVTGMAFRWSLNPYMGCVHRCTFLQAGTREHFLAHLARDWPEELARYQQLYARPHLDKHDAEPTRAEVAGLRSRYGIADRRPVRLEPQPEPEQLGLAM
jgi:hypothetical protein